MSISRLTLPSSFVDAVSERVLMPPEPGYFWANLLYSAVSEAELKATSSIEAAGRTFAGSGGTPSAVGPTLDLSALVDGVRSEAIAVERFAVRGGTSVKFNRTVYSDTTYTEASRDITRATIGTTGVDLSGEQVELTIKRYGGPYTGSAVGPHIIESFDLERANEDLIDKVAKHLRRDRVKFCDAVVGTKAVTGATSSTYVYPGDPNNALTADNSAFLAQGDRPFDLETLFRAEEVAKNNKVPTFANGRWMVVLSAKQERQLKTSSRFEKMAKDYREKNPLFASYIGTVGMMDVFTSQTNATATANSTITVQLGVLMGPGALAYGIAKGCRVEPDDNTNFGQRVMVTWQADEGYQTLDNRFLVSLRSD